MSYKAFLCLCSHFFDITNSFVFLAALVTLLVEVVLLLINPFGAISKDSVVLRLET